jgi:hypothetical protein
MSKITTLVDHLRLQAPETVEKYNQTAVLPMPSYHALCALSEYLHTARTRLSGMLLAAAVEEAIASLPDEPLRVDYHDFASHADYVRYLIVQSASVDEMTQQHAAEQARKTTT